jgi:hypothetical protein
MTIETPAIGIGAFVGAMTAVTTNPQISELGMIGTVLGSPLGSAIVAGGVAVVTIRTSVKIMERDLHEVRKDLKDVATRVARIEGKLEHDA